MSTPFAFEPRLTLDGLMQLAAGIIAFVAVILEVAVSGRRHREQLADEKKARLAEMERQRKAVATAILFEVDNFFRLRLQSMRDFFKKNTVGNLELPGVKSIESEPFPVFAGNTARLGELDHSLVYAILSFYGAASAFVRTVADYKSLHDRMIGLKGIGTTQCEADARILLAQMQVGVPEIVKLCFVVCQQLCDYANVPFEHPTIAVAQENLSPGQILSERQDG